MCFRNGFPKEISKSVRTLDYEVCKMMISAISNEKILIDTNTNIIEFFRFEMTS